MSFPYTDKQKAEIKAQMIEGMGKAATNTFTAACAKANVDRRTVFEWRRTDEEFDAALKEAQAVGRAERADLVLSAAWDRAINGWDETRMTNAGHEYTTHKFWERGLEMWLRSLHPEFKERAEVEHTGRMEVTNPDVTEAIDRFTGTILQLAERSRAELPPGDPPGDSEG